MKKTSNKIRNIPKVGANQDHLKESFLENKMDLPKEDVLLKFGSQIKFSQNRINNKVGNKELLDLDFPDITEQLLDLHVNFDDIDLPDITKELLKFDIKFDEVNIPEITSDFLNFKNDFQDIKIPDITKEFLSLDIENIKPKKEYR